MLLVGFSTAIFARNELKNYMGVWVEGGAASLLTGDHEVANSVGGGGALGFAYELQTNHFLFNLGAGVKADYNALPIDEYEFKLKNQGVAPDLYTYYAYSTQRKDCYTDVSVHVPVMFGGQWNRFYFLAGVKGDFSVLGLSKIKGQLSVDGQYNGQEQMFSETEGFKGLWGGESYSFSDKTKFNIDVDASVEVGGILGYIQEGTGYDVPKTRTTFKLAVFADYGLLNIHSSVVTDDSKAGQYPATKCTTTVGDYTVGPDMEFIDILNSSEVVNPVHKLFVGVKFTVLFELPKSKGCTICRDSQISTASGGKGQGRVSNDDFD